MSKIDFKLKRALYPPDAGKGVFSGEDVLAVKRSISRAGFWPWQEFDEVYSNQFAHGRKNSKGVTMKGWEGVAGFQRKTKVEPATGFYGPGTHDALLNFRVPGTGVHAGEHVWDQFSINLYQGFEDFTAAERIVTEIFSWWDWLVAREPAVHYSMDRPIQPLRAHENPPKLPSDLDCSGTAIYCAWLADALSPDPIYGFTGSGNTGSLIKGGFQINLKDIDRYAREHYLLAFFGPSRWNTKHVTAVKSSRKSYSHGLEAGPVTYDKVVYRGDFLEVRAYPVI